ncbi:DUF4259 domain-containing protein [Corynebacterium sp. H113]|uniref:DUF4259 domain-containing protein n=1 Tax=Corynebacterium sp. H113 TaxID=3133419 RepID=UPI00309B5B55
MSIWDSEIFSNDATIDLFDDVDSLDTDDRADALLDACQIAIGDGASEDEVLTGLAAAVVAAIWSGAPFARHDVVDDYGFIRDGIGESTEALSAAAAEVFENLVKELPEDEQAALEDFAEAVE